MQVIRWSWWWCPSAKCSCSAKCRCQRLVFVMLEPGRICSRRRKERADTLARRSFDSNDLEDSCAKSNSLYSVCLVAFEVAHSCCPLHYSDKNAPKIRGIDAPSRSRIQAYFFLSFLFPPPPNLPKPNPTLLFTGGFCAGAACPIAMPPVGVPALGALRCGTPPLA